MARKKREGPKEQGAPMWMVTYGDMMSLLLTFFVLIVSFSQIEVSKFKAAIGSLRGALQPWNPDPTGSTMIMSPTIRFGKARTTEEAIDEIMEVVEGEGLSNWVEVEETAGGIRIIFSDPVLFDVASDAMKPGVIGIIDKLVRVAEKIESREVLIEGHTDDSPINTDRFPTNWELSAARALSVLKYFQSKGFPPEKLVAVGYGEYRPREKLPPNATSAQKAVNRRVEIFLRMSQPISRMSTDFSYNTGDIADWGD